MSEPETTPEVKLCGACSQELSRTSFSKKQWEHKKLRRCKECIEAKKPIVVVTDDIPKLAPQEGTAKCTRKKQKPVRAAAPTARYNKAHGGQAFVTKLPSQICSWCGKTEEQDLFPMCTGCRNIIYCSPACQKAAWPEHKLVCHQLKQERKDVKAARKEKRLQQRQDAAIHSGSVSRNNNATLVTLMDENEQISTTFRQKMMDWRQVHPDAELGDPMLKGSNSIRNTHMFEQSGTGSYGFKSNPGGVSMAIFTGKHRGFGPPGDFFPTDEARESIRELLGERGFQLLCAGEQKARATLYEKSNVPATVYFTKISELKPTDQFLFSCGPVPDMKLAKKMLEVVLQQIGLKPDGSQPDIGDITVRGYGLNALEWAARRGNHEIAEWLATDPRTKVMLTRTDSAPVAWACFTNRVELAKMLVKHGANSHATYDAIPGAAPPTHFAARNGQLLAVKYLVEECGHDIFERDSRGLNIRTCLNLKNTPGTAAVDEYAKSKGVRA